MSGKRGLGKIFAGFKKPKQGDDDFDIHQLKETIKFLHKDIKASEKTIAGYDRDLKRFAKYPKQVAAIQKMKLIEMQTLADTNDTLIYYNEELIEELKKQQ